jgi:hypothetical protein
MAAKTRKLFLTVCVLAVLLGLLLFNFGSGSISPFPPLPQPNGYDDFMAAGEHLEGDVGAFADMELPALRQLVSSNREALRLVRVGLSHHCAVPLQVCVTNFPLMGSQMIKLRHEAQLLAAEGHLAQMEGRPGDAAMSYAETVRLGNELSRGGLIITRLVGVACEAIGGVRLATLTPDLTPEQTRTTLAALWQIETNRVTWEEIRAGERVCVRSQLFRTRNPIAFLKGWWDSRAANRASDAIHKRALVRLRLLVTELALRCYRADTGKAPATLEALVPGYLVSVPADAFGAGPLVYRPNGTNWLLYSIGPDGVDDGGKQAGKGQMAKGDLIFGPQW